MSAKDIFKKIANGFKGIVKSTGIFLGSLFNFDKLSKSDTGQSIGDNINGLSKACGGKAIFQTEKEKKKAEAEAKKREQEAVAATAENMKEVNRQLNEIKNILEKK